MIKDHIADAFQRHFHQFGFKKTAVDDVAREMQISKKTIYQHFSTKEEILRYVIQRSAQAYLAELAGQVPADADEGQQMEQLIRLIHQVAREFQASNASFALQFRLEIAAAAYRQAYTQWIAALVAAGARRGVFHCDDPGAAAHFITVLVTESLQMALAQPQAAVEEQTVRVVKKILA